MLRSTLFIPSHLKRFRKTKISGVKLIITPLVVDISDRIMQCNVFVFIVSKASLTDDSRIRQVTPHLKR